jgi:sterol desaturase/sphingolipid hydroxylase (fatty acid hydroxylase superfamily)
VHHSAEVLTPLTVWRVHPIDSLVFYNILAIVMGLANGLVVYAFGTSHDGYLIAGNNLLLVLSIHAYVHLQHSHVWIAFRGLAGRILMSPAHHQIHHSMNPRHFNSNFGASLALWDWLFSTLQMPARQSEHLTFGVETDGRDPHGIMELSVAPIVRALAIIKGRLRGPWSSLPEELPSKI